MSLTEPYVHVSSIMIWAWLKSLNFQLLNLIQPQISQLLQFTDEEQFSAVPVSNLIFSFSFLERLCKPKFTMWLLHSSFFRDM